MRNYRISIYPEEFKALEEENERLRKALERIMNEKGDYWYDKMIKVAKEALEK